MNPDEMRAVEALRTLLEADANREAPPSLQVVVMEAFGRRRRGRTLRWWSLGAAVAAIIIVASALRHSSAPLQTQAKPPVPPATTLSSPLPHVGQALPPARMAIRRAVAHRRRPRVPQAPPAPSVLAQFIPVPYAPPLPSGEIRIVRVRMSAEMAQQWAPGAGITQADLVTGEDGIVRAVRWIR